MTDPRSTKHYLDIAARAAMRAFGCAEPNPLVGAVIVKDHQILGIGHHKRFGDLHAEREAIANARSNGHDPRGSTVYCTLEPCSHHGKQPPCTEALVEAGVARVICARRDPADASSGGFEFLRSHGIECAIDDSSELAASIAEPWLHTMETKTPWIIAKWAQTIDGKIATSTGASQWISNAQSRASVHRLRARVDAIGVGMGTVLADDPMLTARGVRKIRRPAIRVVFDTHARFPTDSKLAHTAGQYQTIVCTDHPEQITVPGVRTLRCPMKDGRLDLGVALKGLHSDHGVSTMLIEPGPTLLGSLLEDNLINEALVHLAPAVMGDDDAKPCASGRSCPTLDQMKRFKLGRIRRTGDDVHLYYRRSL